jgi:micrococcal nuclease
MGRIAATVAVLACTLAAGAGWAAPGGAFTLRGTVVSVTDGDTLRVQLDGGRLERVRLIGIDAPERGRCHYAQATAGARRLADDRRVVLHGDPTQATRDRYGRLLAYVWLPGGRDLGYQLVRGAFAKSYVYDRPFSRLAAYRRAEAAAGGKGIWRCGTAPPPAPVPVAGLACQAGYSPCLPVVADLDCGEIDDSLKPIRVTGDDPYRLDGDDDGLGCE